MIPREVATDGVSLGGFPIPIGTGVVVNLWTIGRDPTVWPQSDKFVPERFLAAGAGDAMHFQVKDDYIPISHSAPAEGCALEWTMLCDQCVCY